LKRGVGGTFDRTRGKHRKETSFKKWRGVLTEINIGEGQLPQSTSEPQGKKNKQGKNKNGENCCGCVANQVKDRRKKPRENGRKTATQRQAWGKKFKPKVQHRGEKEREPFRKKEFLDHSANTTKKPGSTAGIGYEKQWKAGLV